MKTVGMHIGILSGLLLAGSLAQAQFYWTPYASGRAVGPGYLGYGYGVGGIGPTNVFARPGLRTTQNSPQSFTYYHVTQGYSLRPQTGLPTYAPMRTSRPYHTSSDRYGSNGYLTQRHPQYQPYQRQYVDRFAPRTGPETESAYAQSGRNATGAGTNARVAAASAPAPAVLQAVSEKTIEPLAPPAGATPPRTDEPVNSTPTTPITPPKPLSPLPSSPLAPLDPLEPFDPIERQ